jgi:hypothetical protein
MMLGDAGSSAAIGKWSASLQRRAGEIRAKYASGGFQVKDMLADVDGWWQIAAQFAQVAPTMSQITREQVTEAQDNSLGLFEFRAELKQLPADAPLDPERRGIGVVLMMNPINWLVRIGTPVLQTQADYQELAAKAVNAPSTASGWVLDQILKTLHLPTWITPTVAVISLVGVGAWAYFSFLAPVGRAARMVRQNPRGRW